MKQDTHFHHQHHTDLTRRTLLQSLAGAGMVAGLPLLPVMPAHAANKKDNRILVVLELSGANDGFNTLVPYADDAYYRLRPNIGIRPNKVRKIDDQFGFSPGMAGFERLFKEGKMAVVHGCGYAQPSYSHFTSAAYWHTGAPNSGEPYGWLGRVADAIDPALTPNFLVNIDERQSLAVRAAKHVPVVFDDPERFTRKGLLQSRPLLDSVPKSANTSASQNYLDSVANSAREASQLVRSAWANYKTPIDYGIISVDLPKVAAMIAADLPTRLYYTSYRHNAFDTHVQQSEVHQRMLTYVSEIGRAHV